jgi:uncharacterized membrane protein YdcZ (DUF606 family)
MRYLILGLVVLAGMFQPAQVAANNRLRKAVESSSLAAFLSFLIGCAALFLVMLPSISSDRGRLSRVTGSPWWAWIGGLSGAFSVFLAIVAAQRTDVSSIVAFTVCRATGRVSRGRSFRLDGRAARAHQLLPRGGRRPAGRRRFPRAPQVIAV